MSTIYLRMICVQFHWMTTSHCNGTWCYMKINLNNKQFIAKLIQGDVHSKKERHIVCTRATQAADLQNDFITSEMFNDFVKIYRRCREAKLLLGVSISCIVRHKMTVDWLFWFGIALCVSLYMYDMLSWYMKSVLSHETANLYVVIQCFLWAMSNAHTTYTSISKYYTNIHIK